MVYQTPTEFDAADPDDHLPREPEMLAFASRETGHLTLTDQHRNKVVEARNEQTVVNLGDWE